MNAPSSFTPADPRALRDACGLFATGVNVIATRIGTQDYGMTANAFMSVSLTPPLIAISIAQTAKMLPRLRESGRFSVSVLATGMEKLAWHFAGKPDPSLATPFEEREGWPVLRGAAAAFLAETAQEVPAGDHVIFLGAVRGLRLEPLRAPLLFHKGRFGEIADGNPAHAHLAAFGEGFW